MDSTVTDSAVAGAATSAPTSPGRPAHTPAAAHPRARKRRKLLGPILLAVVGLAVVLWLGREIYHGYRFVETDNAYVVGHLHQVGPRLEGRVVEVLARENQFVEAGAPLVRLDPLEFQLAVEKAQAALSQTRAQVAQAQAVAAQSDAQVTEAEAHFKQAQAQLAQTAAQLDLAQLNLKRAEELFARGGVVSQADLDNARAAARAAEAAHAANQANVAAAESSIGSARAARTSAHAQVTAGEAGIAVAESALRDTQRKLAYATLVAPAAGRVGNKSVEVGNYVLPGQIVLSIAEENPWIVANFKETQLARMHPGQPVEITIDAIPDRELRGTIESVSPASGAQFALLPPDNATGNFNKVVQRVPVKIVFDPASLDGIRDRLRLGLSAIVNVRVR